MSSGADNQAWWSDSGPEVCEFCRESFHVELGYYCVDCDRPTCPACVLTLREMRQVTCPECHQKDGD